MDARTEPETITAEAVTAFLHTERFGRTLHLLAQVDSTNHAAALLAQHSAPHGTVVLAEQQTAGRGRMGRTWFSPPGDGLYCSVVLRPSDELLDRLPWIPLVSAMAAARAISNVTVAQVRLKWPNDLLHDERKLGGLLCESGGQSATSTSRGVPLYVIAGIGLNVNTPLERFPSDLQHIATSLAIASGGRVNRLRLFVALLEELEAGWAILRTAPIAELIRDYTHWCVTIGRRIRVALPGDERVEGVADGIAVDGSLRVVRTGPDGHAVDVRAGDVIHVR
jgi:BirA family biotin operon repressor/biotin-[acetyl-CoA-carboxylase] ligase